ncbi:RHS repeat domain-containing protein, partial [Facilibium subflavum]|uniref:RHS repeat domain-containing protein n=1 Tax=Facilibium subflavum TaxID=2219058 RepID=UPI0013C328F9
MRRGFTKFSYLALTVVFGVGISINLTEAKALQNSGNQAPNSTAFNMGGNISASINAQTGELSLNLALMHLPGGVKLTAAYDGASNSNLDNLGVGWSLGFDQLNMATHYLSIGGHGQYYLCPASGKPGVCAATTADGEYTLRYDHEAGVKICAANTSCATDIANKTRIAAPDHYGYVILLHNGYQEYLDKSGRFIEGVSLLGNEEVVHYISPAIPNQSVNHMIQSVVVSADGVTEEVDFNYGQSVTLTEKGPDAEGNTHKVQFITDSYGRLSRLVEGQGSAAISFGFDYSTLQGNENAIDEVDYPTGMHANVTYQPGLNYGGSKIDVAEDLFYTAKASNGQTMTMRTLSNLDVESQGQDGHNYIGNGLSLSHNDPTKDALLEQAPADYLYEVDGQSADLSSRSTYNHDHLLKDVSVSDSSANNALLMKEHVLYTGENAGAFPLNSNSNTEPYFTELPANYTKPAEIWQTAYELGKPGDTFANTTQYNAYGQVIHSTGRWDYSNSKNDTGADQKQFYYDDAHYGLLIRKVSIPQARYWQKNMENSTDNDSAKVWALGEENTIATDGTLAGKVIAEHDTGYYTYTNGTTPVFHAVYRRAYHYDNYGRMISEQLSYGAAAASLGIDKGNIVSQIVNMHYVENLAAGACPGLPQNADFSIDCSKLMEKTTTLNGVTKDAKAYLPITHSQYIDKQTGEVLITTDGLGNASFYRYDALGNLIEIITPDGNITRFRTHYRCQGEQGNCSGENQQTTTLPDGRIESVVADGFGLVTDRSVSVLINGKTQTMRTHNTYDVDKNGTGLGLLLSQTDSAGNTIQYHYDDLHQLVSKTATAVTDEQGDRVTMSQHTLVDRINGRKISYTAYNCGQKLCVDGFTVETYDLVTGDLLSKTIFSAKSLGLSDLQADFPVAGIGENQLQENSILTAVNKAIQAKNWLYQTQYIYNGHHQLIK